MLVLASKKTILHVDKRMLCCLVKAYELRSEVKIHAIIKHELMPVTLPFAEIMSHNMRMGNKSFLADFLTEKANCLESITL